jgi:hypothetical protein
VKINTTARSGNGEGYALLETDVYLMEVKAATIEEDKFDLEKDGTGKLKLVLRWEVYEATAEQDEECVGLAVWQRLNPVYMTVKGGGDSKFKAFVDGLQAQGLLPDIDLADFDSEVLVGIKQRATVEKYKKTMGANAGQPGNKITGLMPVRRAKTGKAKNVPTEVIEEEEAVEAF